MNTPPATDPAPPPATPANPNTGSLRAAVFLTGFLYIAVLLVLWAVEAYSP